MWSNMNNFTNEPLENLFTGMSIDSISDYVQDLIDRDENCFNSSIILAPKADKNSNPKCAICGCKLAHHRTNTTNSYDILNADRFITYYAADFREKLDFFIDCFSSLSNFPYANSYFFEPLYMSSLKLNYKGYKCNNAYCSKRFEEINNPKWILPEKNARKTCRYDRFVFFLFMNLMSEERTNTMRKKVASFLRGFSFGDNTPERNNTKSVDNVLDRTRDAYYRSIKSYSRYTPANIYLHTLWFKDTRLLLIVDCDSHCVYDILPVEDSLQKTIENLFAKLNRKKIQKVKMQADLPLLNEVLDSIPPEKVFIWKHDNPMITQDDFNTASALVKGNIVLNICNIRDDQELSTLIDTATELCNIRIKDSQRIIDCILFGNYAEIVLGSFYPDGCFKSDEFYKKIENNSVGTEQDFFFDIYIKNTYYLAYKLAEPEIMTYSHFEKALINLCSISASSTEPVSLLTKIGTSTFMSIKDYNRINSFLYSNYDIKLDIDNPEGNHKIFNLGMPLSTFVARYLELLYIERS